jgi:hypothetical protein
MTCLDIRGERPSVEWEKDLLAEFDGGLSKWGLACSPLIEGDLVIVQPGGDEGSVVALDRESGDLRWAALDDPAGYSSPVVAELAGVRQVVAFTGERLVGLNPSDGSVLWEYAWQNRFGVNAMSPVVVGDHVFISTAYDTGCALLAIEEHDGGLEAKPVFVRSRRLMEAHFSTPVLWDGFLFGFDGSIGSANMVCVNLRSPDRPAWRSRDVSAGQLIRAGDLLIVQSQTGRIALVRATAEDLELLGEVRDLLEGGQAWATPALVGNRLYVRDMEKVVCLELPLAGGAAE